MADHAAPAEMPLCELRTGKHLPEESALCTAEHGSTGMQIAEHAVPRRVASVRAPGRAETSTKEHHVHSMCMQADLRRKSLACRCRESKQLQHASLEAEHKPAV